MDQLPTNGGMLYHEVQESKLSAVSAVHCVNTVLQGPFFSELDLASIASNLDSKEKQVMANLDTKEKQVMANLDTKEKQVMANLDTKEKQVMASDPVLVSGDNEPDQSHNASNVGDFSIQVLEKALDIWGLQVIPFDSPTAESAQLDPENENAFICHLLDHWFCIRKVNGEWYNFNSLHAAPKHLSKLAMAAHLNMFKGFGWSVFLVRGNFPAECSLSSSETSNRCGQWLSPEEADQIFKACDQTHWPTSASNPNPAPQDHSDSNPSQTNEEPEDEELKAAIAASLVDYTFTPSAAANNPAKKDNIEK